MSVTAEVSKPVRFRARHPDGRVVNPEKAAENYKRQVEQPTRRASVTQMVRFGIAMRELKRKRAPRQVPTAAARPTAAIGRPGRASGRPRARRAPRRAGTASGCARSGSDPGDSGEPAPPLGGLTFCCPRCGRTVRIQRVWWQRAQLRLLGWRLPLCPDCWRTGK